MKSRGFTLLEVLIALAIVAMSVGALLGTITSSASNVVYLKDKTLAEWVALNRLTEIRIAQQMPGAGKRTGNAEMGGVRWQWEEEVTELPIKGMWRVDVHARSTGEAAPDTPATSKSNQATAQKTDEGDAAGSEVDKLNWTATVAGIVGSSRSSLQQPISEPLSGGAGRNPTNNPGAGAPGTPGSPNISPPGTPGSPGAPRYPGVPGSKPPADTR